MSKKTLILEIDEKLAPKLESYYEYLIFLESQKPIKEYDNFPVSTDSKKPSQPKFKTPDWARKVNRKVKWKLVKHGGTD